MALAAFDLAQLRFPLAGHGRTLDRSVHDVNQVNPFLGRLEGLALTPQVFHSQHCLDDRRAGRRRAQPAVFHGVGKLFFFERFPGRLHRRQQRGLGESLRRPCLLGKRFDVGDSLWLALCQSRWDSLCAFSAGGGVL